MATSAAVATTTAWGPWATRFHTKSTALTDCVKEMLEWIRTAEQEKEEHRGLEERYKSKIAKAVQGTREQAQRILEKTHTEYRQQLEEKEQTLTNLRHQVTNFELELRSTQDHVDALLKEKATAMERTHKLEQQSQEYLTRCKALAAHNESLKQGQGIEKSTSIQDQKAAAEQALQDFEANKVGWVHNAAKIIASNAYTWLREHSFTSEDPPQEYIDHCIDNALAALELEQSENEWETMDFGNMDFDPMHMEAMSPPTNTATELVPESPIHTTQAAPRPPGLVIPDIHD